MPVFDPLLDLTGLRARLRQCKGLLVVCYCAAWCDTCTQYRDGFETLAGKFPEHVFIWVDIEESPELLGDDLDIENFPTLLVQSETANLFYGPMLPYASHLEKLLGRLDAASPAANDGPPLLRPLLGAD